MCLACNQACCPDELEVGCNCLTCKEPGCAAFCRYCMQPLDLCECRDETRGGADA